MTNHVHLIVKPDESSCLSKAIGETHRRYTSKINVLHNWRGYLWQGRFASFPMDEYWLLKAAAYVELNPVRAGIVSEPWDYRWSSIHAHLAGRDEDHIVVVDPLLELVGDWKVFLQQAGQQDPERIRKHERTGRVLGSEDFVEFAKKLLGRGLKKGRPGRKPKDEV